MKTFSIYPDGNEWCAVAPGFVNLQESAAGFGKTPVEAMEALDVNLRDEYGGEWESNGLGTICDKQSFIDQRMAALYSAS